MKKELQTIDERDFARSNKLVNGRVKLKAKSYDLIRTLATLVSPNDTDFWTYEVEVKSLGIDYKRAKEYIRDIMRNPIEIQNDTKQTFDCYSWCSSMKYKNGFITFKLDPEMQEFMLGLKEQGNFTKTFEKYILPMESLYAKRIYEMLYQVKKYGYRKFELEELQKTLDVPKSMMSFSRFKEKVLLIAIKEINKHSDIYIPVDTDNLKDESWVKLQCGKTRKITHLNFEFRLKSDKGLFTEPKEQTKEQKEIQRLRKIEELEQQIDKELIFLKFGATSTEQKREIYLKIVEFINYVLDNNKDYKDLTESFFRYYKIAVKNGWSF